MGGEGGGGRSAGSRLNDGDYLGRCKGWVITKKKQGSGGYRDGVGGVIV